MTEPSLTMLEPIEFLAIASQLAVLTYYLGVLIYALPLPIYRLKKWAPILIQDSIWAAILIFTYSLLLSFSDSLAGYSGISLESLVAYMQLVIAIVMSVNFIARAFITSLSMLPVSLHHVASVILLPIHMFQYGIILSSTMVMILALILIGAKAKLAALGITLIAMPFRIGRNAGASILAFVLVANVMLPFLPYWIGLILSSIGLAYDDIATYNSTMYVNMWGTISDQYGGYPAGGVILFMKPDDPDTRYWFKVHNDGTYYINRPFKYIRAGDYIVYMEYLGYLVHLIPTYVKLPDNASLTYRLSTAEYELHFRAAENYVFLRPHGVLIPASCKIDGFERYVNGVKLVCLPTNSILQLYLAYPEQCSVDLESNASMTLTSVELVPWYGILVVKKEYRASVDESTRLEIKANVVCRGAVPELQVEEGVAEPKKSALVELLTLITFFIAYPVAVFSYLTVMSMVTLAVARLLGALSPRIIFDY
ncbi:hypothetical protein [Hyperthermus butylicus]|uniref:Conserved crenarchaeal protein n=1 Tax=Hyperthermus butylicus (strain DSM 5456 / JCM 9403 / PLM1-5) TaxID=415426 RepID=A2BMB0_HYPBU|nr:hypothetical protein [Hyperthermus butylicus]ABM81121.1 conserved crenarchaeal protein [Hyperthermus butylicus DSM 5456]